jgi:hypothetical protein
MPPKTLFLLTILFITTACNTSFQIKPRQEVSLTKINAISSNFEPLEAEILSEDKVVEVFDANLFLAGIIPIQVSLTNDNQQPLVFTEKDFVLIDSTGQKFNNIKAKDALDRVFDYYGITAYNIYSYETMKTNFLSHSLALKESFTPGEKRQGLLYFKFEKRSPIPKGLKLKLEKNKNKAIISNVTSSSD